MQEMTVALWPAGTVPGAVGTDREAGDVPEITIYAPQGASNGSSVVICPGGGYGHLAPHEGKPVADWLNSHGATGIVLRYRLAPRYKHPAMGQDVARAMRTVRARAGEWGLDPGRVGVLGFSAGGHLAATASNHFDAGQPGSFDPVEQQSSRPDVAVLIYPVIAFDGAASHSGSRRNLLGDDPDPALVTHFNLHERVTAQTPPTFLVHSTDDTGVPVENSLRYALALEAAGVSFAMQVYDRGGHGYGMGCDNDPLTTSWPDQCARWLTARGFFDG